MTLHGLIQRLAGWPAHALTAVLLALLPATASAALSASATMTATQISGGYHYAITLDNTGSTTVGTFWFAWVPGANFMTVAPTNVQTPSGWTANFVGPSSANSIQWVATNTLAAGGSLSGFSFDSTLTPSQMTGPASGGNEVVTSFVYTGAPLVGTGFQFNPTVSSGPTAITAVASVLPGGRSVQTGSAATVFASFINTGSTTLNGCDIALPSSPPAGLAISYQTTNSSTNALTGSPNTPVSIAGNNGLQTFLLSFTDSTAVTAPGLALNFSCSGTTSVATIPGVNTVDLLFSTTPVTDIIALAAVATNNGIVSMPVGGAGAFAVATINAGAAGTITASTDTNGASLPVSVSLCQTNASAQCMGAPSSTVTLSDAAGATPTFSVFVSDSGAISLDPANSRIFVRFKDGSGTSHGSTSVAVETM